MDYLKMCLGEMADFDSRQYRGKTENLTEFCAFSLLGILYYAIYFHNTARPPCSHEAFYLEEEALVFPSEGKDGRCCSLSLCFQDWMWQAPQLPLEQAITSPHLAKNSCPTCFLQESSGRDPLSLAHLGENDG